ncbi:MAG: SAM-dependent methyltransferase [Myxococcales bacterium]|nr:SAM-dependent methyltransferase [Myxococcales bacterium]
MTMTKASRGRLRRALPRKLSRGWERAVFAAPQSGADDEPREQVLEGPGAGDEVDEARVAAAIEALLDAAEAAAADGLTKQTIVVDDRRRLTYDARHGHLKTKTLDAATARKVMGGKERLFRPDRSAAFLRAIGIMNADGTISTRHARKYKQISHLAELCRPTWERVAKRRELTDEAPLRVLDLACGNAYLSFVIAEALRLAEVPLRLHGVDVRDDLIARARGRAAEIGLEGLSFARATIAAAYAAAETRDALGGPPDIIVALHACDTATDEALELAIRSGAPAILCVPCCQHELAGQLAAVDASAPPPGNPAIPALLGHGLLRGAYADALTDAIRCELLTACGYQVDVVEFVGSEHTAKNLLIRAHRRRRGAVDPAAWELAAVADACARMGVSPSLLRRLEGAPRGA